MSSGSGYLFFVTIFVINLIVLDIDGHSIDVLTPDNAQRSA